MKVHRKKDKRVVLTDSGKITTIPKTKKDKWDNVISDLVSGVTKAVEEFERNEFKRDRSKKQRIN